MPDTQRTAYAGIDAKEADSTLQLDADSLILDALAYFATRSVLTEARARRGEYAGERSAESALQSFDGEFEMYPLIPDHSFRMTSVHVTIHAIAFKQQVYFL